MARSFGRGSGGGRGRGGRGRFGRGRGGQGQNRRTEKAKPKAVEMEFYPHSSTHKGPTATYATVLDHICHHIQHTYDYDEDIAKSLWKDGKVDLNKHIPILMKLPGDQEQ